MTATNVTALPHRRETKKFRKPRAFAAFHLPFQRGVCKLADRSRAIEDLAESFPALLFALTTGYGTPRLRTQTIAMIEAGKPLRQCAAHLQLPWWMRKLPPGSLTRPIGALPTGGTMDTRFAQLPPSTTTVAGAWLDRVSYATQACHDEFGLWVGKKHRFTAPAASSEVFLHLTAWAWHADQPDTLGHGILRKPWSSGMGLRRAVDEMTAWRRRIALTICLRAGVNDTWIMEGKALGFDFVALRTVDDFIAESHAMNNCLDQYAEHLENGVTRIFSVRKDGIPVADIEIGTHPEEPRMPAMIQLRGPRNRRASPEVWQAAYAWLGSSSIKLLPAERSRYSSAARRREARKKFWQPYLETLKGTGHEEAFKLSVLASAMKRSAQLRRQGEEIDVLSNWERTFARRGRDAE